MAHGYIHLGTAYFKNYLVQRCSGTTYNGALSCDLPPLTVRVQPPDLSIPGPLCQVLHAASHLVDSVESSSHISGGVF